MEKLRQHLTNNQDLLKHSTADVVLTVSGEKFNVVVDHVKKVSQSGQMVCQRIEKMYADHGQPFPQDVLDTKEALDRYMRIVHDKMMVVVDCWNGVQKKVDGIKVRALKGLLKKKGRANGDTGPRILPSLLIRVGHSNYSFDCTV